MIEHKFIEYALGKTKDPILILNEDYYVSVEDMVQYSMNGKDTYRRIKRGKP